MSKEQMELYMTKGKLQEIVRELDFIFDGLIEVNNQDHMILHNLFQDVRERMTELAEVVE